MPTGGQRLGSQLGTLLFGAPDDGSAWLKGQLAGTQAQSAIETARKARADAIIREAQGSARTQFDPTALIDPNATLEQRAAALKYAALGDLGGNINSSLDAYKTGRSQSRIDAADEAFRSGNTSLGNLLLATSEGKPLDTTTVSDGTAYNKYGTPDQGMQTTAVGLGDILAKQASAANSYASAAKSRSEIGAAALGGGKSSDYQITTGPDGTIYRVNKLTGKADVVDGALGGGASLGNLGFKKDSLAVQKGTGANQVTRGLKRIESAVNQLSNNTVFDGGPIDQYLIAPTKLGQEIEQANGAIMPALTALTRVPGVGSQSDWEGRLNMMQLPSPRYAPEVNKRAIAGLKAFVTDLQSAYEKAGIPFPEDASQLGSAGPPLGELSAPSGAPSAKPLPGQVENGYRFKGGDPANPMNWEKQ